LAETNSSGTTLNEYIFFNGNRVARRDSSGNVYYYFQDHLGTTKTLTTSAGAVCYDADFGPYGYEWAYVNSCAQNYKFTGLERDSETGNDHTLHRMYDSGLGRWLTPDRHRGDPFNPQSWNRYAYVLDNPTNLTDPYGLVNGWQLGKGALQVVGGVVVIIISVPAEAPTAGASTLGIIAGGSAVGAGLINLYGGFTETPGSAALSSAYQTLTNPLGAAVAFLTGDLGLGGAAALIWDVGNVCSEMPEALGNPLGLQGLNFAADLFSTGAGVVQYADENAQEVVYTAANATSITVTGTPTDVPYYNEPANPQLVDQDDSSGSSGGEGASGDEGGGSGAGYDWWICDDSDC
jgi:RHS repeat-associated protein